MASTASPEALYSFANLGGIDLALFRMRGVGLANCLFPWARCIVATRQFALRRIASTWPQLCHRQWLGPQQDRRTYLGLFDETGSAISGVKRLRLLLGLPRITEQQFLQQSMAHQSGIVVFSNIGGYFSAMLDNHAMVRDALIGMTKSEHRIGLEAVPGNSYRRSRAAGRFSRASRSDAVCESGTAYPPTHGLVSPRNQRIAKGRGCHASCAGFLRWPRYRPETNSCATEYNTRNVRKQYRGPFGHEQSPGSRCFRVDV